MWDHLCARFVSYMHMRNFSEHTIIGYSSCVRFFFGYLKDEGIVKLSDVTREVVSGYQSHLYYYEHRGKRNKFSTQAHKLSAVRSFFRYLVREGYLAYDPTGEIELPKVPRSLPRGVMSVREVEKILEVTSGDYPLALRDRAMLEVLYSTAIRNGELISIKLSELDLRGGEIRVRYAKGKKERVVPLGSAAVRALRRYLDEGRPRLCVSSSPPWLFLSVTGRKLDGKAVLYIVKKHVKRAGVKKDVVPHSFRHTCASHLLKGHADLRHIQELLGHESIASTEVYTKVELSQLKEVHRKCHPREKFSRSFR